MPIPNYNQDIAYWCDKLMDDLEYDSIACNSETGWQRITHCRQCVHFNQQAYSIVIQDESQKHFISPSIKCEHCGGTMIQTIGAGLVCYKCDPRWNKVRDKG